MLTEFIACPFFHGSTLLTIIYIPSIPYHSCSVLPIICNYDVSQQQKWERYLIKFRVLLSPPLTIANFIYSYKMSRISRLEHAMHLWRFHREEEESWSLPELLNFKAPVAITKFLNPDLQSKLLNAANIQCWWRVREEGEGKGREGESYKGWRRDADDLQWYSSAALSIPPLINTTLDPAIDSSSSWSTSSSPSEKPSPSVSLSLSLSLSVRKEAPNLLLTGYAGNWMIPKNKEDLCFSLSIKEAKSLATKIPGNFSVENPSSGLGASSSNRISCHKFPGNFSLLGISSSGLGGASSNIYLSCHKFQQTLLWNP